MTSAPSYPQFLFCAVPPPGRRVHAWATDKGTEFSAKPGSWGIELNLIPTAIRTPQGRTHVLPCKEGACSRVMQAGEGSSTWGPRPMDHSHQQLGHETMKPIRWGPGRAPS